MDKKQTAKIEVIKKYLPGCCSSSVGTVFVYGNIPKDRFHAACTAYAGNVTYEETIGLVDETFMSTGKKGCLFTLDGFYYTGCKEIVRYDCGMSFNTFRSYNVVALNEMLKKLYDIETKQSLGSNILNIAKVVGVAMLERCIEGNEDKVINQEEEITDTNCLSTEDDIEEKELLMKRYREVKKNDIFIKKLAKVIESCIEEVEINGQKSNIEPLREIFDSNYEEKTSEISSDIELYIFEFEEKCNFTDVMNGFKKQLLVENYDQLINRMYDLQKEIDKIKIMYEKTVEKVIKDLKDDFDFEVQ